ncbi:MAG: single-stranded-DNA-specific exonuclease RecJ [Candidatus Caenarcaniphilales bacterium]|nr:single-stranded-DNA-specific exonuclease RecJ [Candidatus Caenarcaniphilales bacterium]
MKKSFFGKQWKTSSVEPSQDLINFCSNYTVANILAKRGIISVQEASYYVGSNPPIFSSPYEIPDLEKAIARIERAIDKQENIVIYGDYDVDGTTSTALLTNVLESLGAKVSFFIPNRFTDGYGLNTKAVVQIKSQRKATLLITCDCGITNFDEIKLAQSLGLDVIVTDHHSLPEILPPAVAVLNPKLLPDKHPLHWLPGVGVAYKLAEALLVKDGQPEAVHELLDLVALGMIADLAPLKAENRLLVIDGLKVLNNTTRPGLQALLLECGYQSDEEGVGFAIAPRINAAGRLQDASDAVKLFLSKDKSEALMIAKQLSSQNSSRQQLCDEIFKEAIEKIEKEVNLETERGILLCSSKWHHGVVGIVASRLVEKYHVPVFLGVEEDGKVKGSARGISSIDLFEEMNKNAELFSKFGGHKAAAGFSMTLENWQIFKQRFLQQLLVGLSSKDLEPVLEIDSEIDISNLNLQSLEAVWKMAPFGFGYPKPIFSTKEDFEIQEIKGLGKNNEHTKLLLKNGDQVLETIQWRVTPDVFQEAKEQGRIKIAFTASKRSFNGRTYLQMELKDWISVSDNPNYLLKNSKVRDSQSLYQQQESLTEQSKSLSESLPEGTLAEQPIESFVAKADLNKTNAPIEELAITSNVDLRNKNPKIEEIISDNLSCVIFAEGQNLKQIQNENLSATCFYRLDKLKQTYDSLVMFSIPLQKSLIRKAVLASGATKVIWIGNNLQETHDPKSFLKKLISHLREQKTQNQSEKLELSLDELASNLESLEETCLEGLRILEQSGMLTFKLEASKVTILLSGTPQKVRLDTENLKKQLESENQIKHKLLTASPSQINSLIK